MNLRQLWRLEIVNLSSVAQSLDADKKDPLVKNPWRWEWLDYTHKDQKLSESFHLVKKPGYVYVVCVICDKEAKYALHKRKTLTDHVESKGHLSLLKIRRTTSLLPGKPAVIHKSKVPTSKVKN